MSSIQFSKGKSKNGTKGQIFINVLQLSSVDPTTPEITATFHYLVGKTET